MWFWIIAGIFVALLLFGAWLWDQRWTLDQTKADEGRRPDVSPYQLGDGSSPGS